MGKEMQLAAEIAENSQSDPIKDLFDGSRATQETNFADLAKAIAGGMEYANSKKKETESNEDDEQEQGAELENKSQEAKGEQRGREQQRANDGEGNAESKDSKEQKKSEEPDDDEQAFLGLLESLDSSAKKELEAKYPHIFSAGTDASEDGNGDVSTDSTVQAGGTTGGKAGKEGTVQPAYVPIVPRPLEVDWTDELLDSVGITEPTKFREMIQAHDAQVVSSTINHIWQVLPQALFPVLQEFDMAKTLQNRFNERFPDIAEKMPAYIQKATLEARKKYNDPEEIFQHVVTEMEKVLKVRERVVRDKSGIRVKEKNTGATRIANGGTRASRTVNSQDNEPKDPTQSIFNRLAKSPLRSSNAALKGFL